MKFTISTLAVVAALAVPAVAQQVVLGTGAFSASESSYGGAGSSVSGAGSIGPGIALSSNVTTMGGNLTSTGVAAAGTTIAASAAGSQTTAAGSAGVGNTSFSTSTGQAGGIAFGTNNNAMFNGSAANAFGGVGLSLN